MIHCSFPMKITPIVVKHPQLLFLLTQIMITGWILINKDLFPHSSLLNAVLWPQTTFTIFILTF